MFAAGACALPACGAADGSGNDTFAAEGKDAVGEVREALDWKAALCKIANAPPTFDVGGFKITKSCTYEHWDQLSYFGSNGASEGDYAKTMATTMYCALADSSGDWVGATVNTPVGQFGAVRKLHACRAKPGQVVRGLSKCKASGLPPQLSDYSPSAVVRLAPDDPDAIDARGYISPSSQRFFALPKPTVRVQLWV